MDTTGWLQTLAEVAVAMAGFSAVITAFSPGGRRIDPMMANRLYSIVSLSLLVAFLSIVPTLGEGLGLEPVAALRTAAAIGLAMQLRIFVTMRRGYRSIPGYSSMVSMTGVYFAYAFMVITGLSGAACLFDLFEGRGSAFFLIMQTSMLATAGTRLWGLTSVLASRHAVDGQAE